MFCTKFPLSELYVRADFVAALRLDDHILAGRDSRSKQNAIYGSQRKFRRIIGLAEVTERKFFASTLDQIQNFRCAGAIVQVPTV